MDLADYCSNGLGGLLLKWTWQIIAIFIPWRVIAGKLDKNEITP